MKVKIELFGAARDFNDQNLLELDLGQKTTIKDIRNKIIQYVEQKFNGNESYIKIINSSAFCSEKNNIVSDNYKITNNEKIGIIPPIGGG
ncbi:molybdopterin biosynthesis protein MoeD [Candidatus Pelagibacter sp.]|uniref:molybdopterin biosynthesis protein MoeD n=1 Tax=Candidatus Pelagibacter sp. TaxID=2024849 RepID=UPI003F87B609